jgi:hypothetical protein
MEKSVTALDRAFRASWQEAEYSVPIKNRILGFKSIDKQPFPLPRYYEVCQDGINELMFAAIVLNSNNNNNNNNNNNTVQPVTNTERPTDLPFTLYDTTRNL